MAGRNGKHPCFPVFAQNLMPVRFFLQSNDGHVIELEEKIGMMFHAIKRLVKQGHISLSYECRRLVALNSSKFVLDIVIDYTKNYAKLLEKIEMTNSCYITLIRARNETDLKFIKWVTDKQVFGFDKPQTVRLLGDIAAAAGDLGMQRLLDVSCGALSRLTLEYTEDEIFALLGVRIKKLSPKIDADDIAAHIGHARDLQRRSYGSYPNYMAGVPAQLQQPGTNMVQRPDGTFYWAGDQEVNMEGMIPRRRIPEDDYKINFNVPPGKDRERLSRTFGPLRRGDDGPLFTDLEMLRMLS